MSKYPLGITTLEDNIKVNSNFVIKYILTKLTTNQLLFLCLEKLPNKWENLLDLKAKYIYFQNPNDWKSFPSNSIDSLQTIDTVIIDSINQLSALLGWEKCLRVINELRNFDKIKNICIICHNDCLLYGIKMINNFKYISQTYAVLESSSNAGKYYLNVKSKMAGGKIKSYVEEIFYDNCEKKWNSCEVHQDKLKIIKQQSKMPEELTSFKISIEEPAKAVKESMILPYTEVGKGNSNVIYHHDAADDWDDEDPDDDLDI